MPLLELDPPGSGPGLGEPDVVVGELVGDDGEGDDGEGAGEGAEGGEGEGGEEGAEGGEEGKPKRKRRRRIPPDERQRALRRDAGRVVGTGRDAAALRWIAEQFTVRPDALAVLLARLGDPEARKRAARQARRPSGSVLPGRVSDSMVSRTLGRWEAIGWARVIRLGGHRWVIPTAEGYRVAGLEPKRTKDTEADAVVMEPWPPRLRILPHVHAVGLVRLHLEPKLAGGQRWISERELRREDIARMKAKGEKSSHLHIPDGAIAGAEGDRVAVEVELTLKSPALWEAAVWRVLPEGFASVQMFASAHLLPTIRARLAAGDTRYKIEPEALPDLGISYMEE